VTLSAARETDVLRIEVRDTGTGIAPEALPHVFDRFYRSADSSGSGLGLPIARSLVEAHGGTIEALAAEDGGTTIRVRLPLGGHVA
jgi:two-component system sensor histidine kinase BaeS